MKTMMLLAVAMLCGCASVKVTTPDGFELSRKSWIWSSSKLASASMVLDTNGTRTIKLQGYEQTNTETLAQLATTLEAVADSFVK